MHAFIDFGIAFSSFSLDGVSVLCVGLGALRPDSTVLDFGTACSRFFPGRSQRFGCWALGPWARRLHFTVLASGIALSSCSLDGVSVLGVVLWLRGPMGEILKCLILA